MNVRRRSPGSQSDGSHLRLRAAVGLSLFTVLWAGLEFSGMFDIAAATLGSLGNLTVRLLGSLVLAAGAGVLALFVWPRVVPGESPLSPVAAADVRRPGMDRLVFLALSALAVAALVASELRPVWFVPALGLVVSAGLLESYEAEQTTPEDEEPDRDTGGGNGDGETPADPIPRRYEWQHAKDGYRVRPRQHHTFRVAVQCDRAELEHFRELNADLGFDPAYFESRLGTWILDGATPAVDRLAERIVAQARREDYDRYELIDLILQFVHHFPYAPDAESRGQEEYGRFPLETLVDEEGDCDCFTILFLTLLRSAGFEDFCWLSLPGHAAAAVRCAPGMPGTYYTYRGHRYYFCETTGDEDLPESRGWRVGQMPERLRGGTGRVQHVEEFDRAPD